MFKKKYNTFIDSINIIIHNNKLCNNFSSVFLNANKKKPINIDNINKINKKNGLNCKRNELLENEYKKSEENKKITKLCEQLSDNLRKKEYNLYENNLIYSLSIAENAIEISQLINVISKNKINNNIKSIYVKLINKSLKIFDNIPIRSVSLILNSMLKLNYYHNDFIFLFFKNIKKMITESNSVDICILFHFYINVLDRFSYLENKSDVLLNLFLNKIYNAISSFQIHSISCILRCNKKLIKRKWILYNNGNINSEMSKKKTLNVMNEEKEKKTDEIRKYDNAELIEKINEILKNNFYLKISYASIQQLCNILEDLEFFNLIDDNCYYDVLNILKNKNKLDNFKDIDYLNILNIIKSRNIKYNNLFPITHFYFLFDEIKNKNFDEFSCDDLAELIKILYYFKKFYHINFCMNKLEISLDKRNLDDISSVSTLIYLLYDFSLINKSNNIINSLNEKLFLCIMNKIHEKKELQKKKNEIKNDISSKNYNIDNLSLPIRESLLLVKSLDILIDKRIINSNYLIKKNFFLINCKNDFQVSYYDKYSNFVLYKMLLLGKVKYNNFFVFLNLLKNSLILSLYFCIKDIVLFLKALCFCSYFISKDNYLIFENTLNYLSFLIISQSMLLKKKSSCYSDEFMKKMNNTNNFLNDGNLNDDNNLDHIYKRIEKIIEKNYIYINEMKNDSYHITNISDKMDSGLNEVKNIMNNIDEDNNLNFKYTKISSIDCSNILYYFQKLNYVNYDMIKILLKNIYININHLKNNHILKIINGLSIIKNVDTKLNSFNYIINKVIIKFISSHKENDNYVLKIDETIKLLYLISKLNIINEYKNNLIRKHILIYLENILKNNKLSVKNIQLLLQTFKSMYPYRYANLIEYSLNQIDQVLDGKHFIKNDISNKNDVNEMIRKSSENVSDTFSISFLKVYFSSIPILINPITNIYSNMNDLYLNTSEKLFEQLCEYAKSNEKLKKDIIPFVIDFMNLSFSYSNYVHKYIDFIIYIFEKNEIISKNQFCMILLNLKFFSHKLFKTDNCKILNMSKKEFLNKTEEYLRMFYNDNTNNEKISYDENFNSKAKSHNKSSYDFTFNKKKLIFCDTEDDNEEEIISREYNYIDINNLYEKNVSIKKKNTLYEAQNVLKDKEKKEVIKKKNLLNEFEIILKKYSYCQNNEQDKIQISNNVKVYVFHIKYIDLKKRIIFEFLEEHDYLRELDNSSIEILPFISLRLLFLNKLKFEILLMPFYEWENSHGRLEKVKTIFQKLLNITNNSDFYLNQKNKTHIFSSIGQYE
ncbi:RAP protein, putative [Plasmodium relictum]|uniref:RAP protein, putative n=1 Tax=Plasmodium relictum TaxID=85471 RepID=A0A1J1H8I4_PLARL|nr:RAP protein, putative [Plasmodium relictum]CRH01086.1 RAP protein, putative [Plasmodium relictum]